MNDESGLHEPMQKYAAEVQKKMSQTTHGEPEDQLRAPFEAFFRALSSILGVDIVCIGETNLPNRIGRPDYAIHVNGILVGYVELKAPGTGVMASSFRGHNKKQFKRFSAIPNIIYTDGNQWALYRSGKLIRKVKLSGEIILDGKLAATIDDAQALEPLLRDFCSWEPIIPIDRNGQIDLNGFAQILAPLTRMLRDDVTDSLKDPDSPLVELADDWRQLLFPDASDRQFSDAYAQTVAFALLLGRSEGADPLSLDSAEEALRVKHSLLSRALQVLTVRDVRTEMSASLDMLVRIIAAVPPVTFEGPCDPWLYFYEDFLATYDPKLRKDAGVYYTPIEVVRCQVRLTDELLVKRLKRPLSFADPGVFTLDPAAGTGTYLLGIIEHTLDRFESEQGKGAVPGQGTELAKNLHAFELMVGPYAVTELRVSRALSDRGAAIPNEGMHIYLTDTLESPDAEPLRLPLFLRPIAEQHARALKVKSNVPVIVCLGNPPYDRHEAATSENKARTGGWVRWGNDGNGTGAIFEDFLNPVLDAGHGVHAKWLYNLYVYFWRWALWKVFESNTSSGPGIVSFISASSYLFGDAFVGMREHMRRVCDEIWILDLGGEARGGRKDENIFAIQTPVTIAVALRMGVLDRNTPAQVRYCRIRGTAEEKLKALDGVTSFKSLTWEDCPDEWAASFLPSGEGDYFDWPIIMDLFPWQHSGSQLFRSWPIAPNRETLKFRWRALLQARDRANAFKESRDRKIDKSYKPLLVTQERAKPIASLPATEPCPDVSRYAFRSFDRQYVILDSRIGDVMKPILWEVQGDHRHSQQVFLTSQLWQVLGDGPALTASISVPDFHHFKGSYGGKDVIPLYRDADAKEPNILPGLLDLLGKEYSQDVNPGDFMAYSYGLLAQPAFTKRFREELGTRELRVPLTRDPELYERVRDVGARLLWLHTYGERFLPEGIERGQSYKGKARCTVQVPYEEAHYPEKYNYDEEMKTLHVGDGEFSPVEPEVYEFEVSGLKVVQSWLGYRMKEPKGRRTSPLDDINVKKWSAQFTTELLELLWVLEGTIDSYIELEQLFEKIVAGECINKNELPDVPDSMREAPKQKQKQGHLFESDSNS